MKALLYLGIFLFATSLLAQEQDINPKLYEKTWQDNETRYFNGFAVTKIFGHVFHAPAAYNFLPITAVAYKDLNQLKAELTKTAEENNWSDQQRDEEFKNLEKTAKGGELEIYLARGDEDRANFKWFFVIIRGGDDKGKLWEKDLSYQAPEVPYDRGWWNYTTVKIPIELTPPFYVYFNDKQSQYLSDFKFLIETASGRKEGKRTD